MPRNLNEIVRLWIRLQGPFGQCILFSIVFIPPTIFLLLTLLTQYHGCGVAYPSIWLERFRGNQKEDERGPNNTNSSMIKTKRFFFNFPWLVNFYVISVKANKKKNQMQAWSSNFKLYVKEGWLKTVKSAH